jgi:alkylation response protein AidB-like acyl-CoA dehydrogenase
MTDRTSDLERVDALIDELVATHEPRATDVTKFRGAQYDAGLAWVHFPEGFGGLGLAPTLQRHIDQRVREAGARAPHGTLFFGLSLAGPTVATHGSDELRARALRPMFTGEEIWCQLFSEPGAGSDLAGLATRAVRDGDEWIVNGQKVWNTLAHLADRGMLVARTDPKLPKHKGLTYFMVDMHAPGVEVRPLRQITGEAEFNEVYLTDVRIADSDRIGDIGEGWRVSMTTLMNERTTIGGASSGLRRAGPLAEMLDIWKHREDQDPVLRDKLARFYIDFTVLGYINQRAAAQRKAGNPGPEGSIAKLQLATLNQTAYELCIDLLGPDGLVGYDYTFKRPDEAGIDAPLGSARKMFLRARANSIEGGTSEIMRNILGERILGLPGEPRVDRDVPWSQVPRS